MQWDRSTRTAKAMQRFRDTSSENLIDFNWDSYLINLRSPIIVFKEVKSVIWLENLRVYPPFQLNTTSNRKHLFDGTQIPTLDNEQSLFDPPGGVHLYVGVLETQAVCYGMRLDIEKKSELNWNNLGYILSCIREISMQWWINSILDPFDLGSSYMLEKSIRPAHYKASGLQMADVCWAENRFLSTLDFVTPVTKDLWSYLELKVKANTPLESASIAFFDALSAYMGNLDAECQYQLFKAMEIMERKVRRMHGRPTNQVGAKLLKGAVLWLESDKKIIIALFAARSQAAHGLILNQIGKIDLRDFLDLVYKYYRTYRDQATDFGWHLVCGFVD